MRREPNPARPVPAFLAAAAAAALVLAGCGSDDSSTTTSPAASTVVTATTVDASASTVVTTTDAGTTPASSTTATSGSDAEATANAVTIETPGMSFVVSGSLRPGVATITLRNDDTVAHMMSIARLKEGVTLDQVRDALAENEEDAVTSLLADDPATAIYGTPAPVGAGESTTVTAQDLPAGTYLLACFFTTADGTPHAAQGMIGTLDVSGDTFTASPETAGTITLRDDGADLPDTFSGRGTYLVTNAGTTPHSISFARLDAATTLEAYYQHVGAAENGGGTIDGGGGALVGGVDGLLPGQSAYLTLDLSPGHYGFISTQDATGPELPVIHGEFDVA